MVSQKMMRVLMRKNIVTLALDTRTQNVAGMVKKSLIVRGGKPFCAPANHGLFRGKSAFSAAVYINCFMDPLFQQRDSATEPQETALATDQGAQGLNGHRHTTAPALGAYQNGPSPRSVNCCGILSEPRSTGGNTSSNSLESARFWKSRNRPTKFSCEMKFGPLLQISES
jgi:hypothetical protein